MTVASPLFALLLMAWSYSRSKRMEKAPFGIWSDSFTSRFLELRAWTSSGFGILAFGSKVEGISAWKIVLPDGRCADDVPIDATVREGFKR
mmetsp:Transcript_23310/g.55353  ORF Transcript_23310/g.55353 Transcript_23310/m.55353 type:complete len:91 (+) Transcript_23310:664-936(+)